MPNETRILIVDDTLENIQVLDGILQRENYQINVARNGVEALDVVDKLTTEGTPPDLILLDVMMPRLDGYGVCQRLKEEERFSDIPVVFLTAKTDADDVARGFELGAVDYVTKPFKAIELLARVRTHLELRDLRRGLEDLVAARTAEVQRTNRIYERFVPKQFVQLLGHQRVLDLDLEAYEEEHTALEMTVLFSDIVSFTELSEQMGPNENFRFINSFLSQVSPVIRDRHGFIDKYLGDGIMALFSDPVDSALHAAIDMQQRVDDYNVGRVRAGYQPIRVGVGLHTGELMLGLIGELERMDTSVISDSVNVAARLENLTRLYQVDIIASGETLQRLEDPDRFSCRPLDRVQVKGKLQPVTIYEVFNGDPPELQERKRQTLDAFKEALALYYDRKFTDANLAIAHVLAQNPEDKLVHLYQQRIALAIAQGVPDDWDGVERLAEK